MTNKHIYIFLFLLFLSACSSSLTQTQSELQGLWKDKEEKMLFGGGNYSFEFKGSSFKMKWESFSDTYPHYKIRYTAGTYHLGSKYIYFDAVDTDSLYNPLPNKKRFIEPAAYILSEDTLRISFYPEVGDSAENYFSVLIRQR